MKSKIIIEDGMTKIELTPETEFEKRLIEDGKRSHADTSATFHCDKKQYYSDDYKDHLLTISLYPPMAKSANVPHE